MKFPYKITNAADKSKISQQVQVQRTIPLKFDVSVDKNIKEGKRNSKFQANIIS